MPSRMPTGTRIATATRNPHAERPRDRRVHQPGNDDRGGQRRQHDRDQGRHGRPRECRCSSTTRLRKLPRPVPRSSENSVTVSEYTGWPSSSTNRCSSATSSSMKPAPSAPKYASHRAQPGAGPAAADEQRPDDEQHDERGGDAKQREQRAQAVAEEHRPAERHVELIGQPRGVEEERPVVGRRPDVERIGVDELLAVGGPDESRVVRGAGARLRPSLAGRRRRSPSRRRPVRRARRIPSRVACAVRRSTSSGVNGVFFRRNVATRSWRTMARWRAGSSPRAAHASCASDTRRRPSKTQRVIVSTPSSVRWSRYSPNASEV